MKKIVISVIVVAAFTALILFFILPGSGKFEPPKKILFLLFDAARADHFTPYGYERDTTPFINELAKDGVLFENAYSQASWTLPSVISLFTAMYTDFHGAVSTSGYMQERFISLADFLKNEGYTTAGAYKNRWLVPKKNLNSGFDFWEYTRDRFITDFGIMFMGDIRPEDYQAEGTNYFADFPPDQTEENRKDWHLNPREIWKDIFTVNPEAIAENRKIEVISTEDEIEPGRYIWGTMLRCKFRGMDIELALEGITDDGRVEIIDRREKQNLNHWEMLNFNATLKKKYKKIILYYRQTKSPVENDSKMSIKRPYFIIITDKKKPQPTGTFTYLHYLNPHSPHISPGQEYDNLFTDYLLPKGRVSNPPGDANGLNILKAELQKGLIRNWSRVDDDINVQMNNYDRQLRFIDDQTRRIVTYLKETDQYDDTLIILTADHGEEFFDHGYIAHKMSLYNECIHIPLIMIYPNGLPSGKRIKENVALIDIFPTFLEMIGTKDNNLKAEIEKQAMGRSLLPLIFDRENNFNERIIYSSDFLLLQSAAIKGSSKLIKINSACYDKSALFDISSDPKETLNIQSRKRKTAELLRTAIRNYLKRLSKFPLRFLDTKSTLDEHDVKLLKGLGYLDFDEGKKPDPYCRRKREK